MEKFDLIVAGGGSAGCIVAAKACESGMKVLLLEGGPDTEYHPATLRADGYKDAFTDDELLWHRFSVRDKNWGHRRTFAGTGRGLGGSGSINGMVYTRGAAVDFEEWPKGWQWDDVCPDFDAVEEKLGPKKKPATEWSEAAIGAAEEAGFRRSEDLNDGDLSGVLGYEFMNSRDGQRRSSYVAFLRPIRDRLTIRLTIMTGALVDRVLFDGTRAIGVEFRRGGAPETAMADEIVLCAGALATPAILLRSGVGPSGHLRSLFIPVIADRAEVGENLHDHPNVQVFFRGKREVDCNYPQLYGFHRARPSSNLPAGQSDSCYVFYPARSSLREGMMRIVPGMVLPEALYNQSWARRALMGAIGAGFKAPALRDFVQRLWAIVVILGKPESRGNLRLASRNPHANPLIDPGYLREPGDLETMIDGVLLARETAMQPAMAAYQGGEIFPGPLGKNRAAIGRWIRTNLMTTYHFAGTCRMGHDDAAPVDPDTLRVRGVEGLRVADASVMPVTPVAALNAPSMMIGYRAARLVVG